MRVARLGTILLLLLSACMAGLEPDDGPDAGPDPGTRPDGAADPAPLGFERSGTSTCFDGTDNDLDTLLDCADDDCDADSVCCVGSASCCDTGTPVSLSIPAGCEDVAASDCAGLASDLTPFGDPEPDFEMGGLVPRGGSTWGGIALGDPADPRASNLVVKATVEVPASRCTDCIDAAGVGFLDALPAFGERASVQLGVLVNGGRQELQVLVYDVPVETRSLTAGTHLVEITLRIDGTASVALGGTSIAELADMRLPATLQPAVFGRTQGAGAPAVRVTTASARIDPCDVPSALSRRSAPVLPASSTTWAPNDLGRPSVLTFGPEGEERTVVAFAHDGEILLAEPDAIGELVGSSGGAPDSILGAFRDFEVLHDPWLITDGDSVVLYLAGETPDGERTLLRTSGGAGFGLVFAEPVPLTLPEDIGSIDGPTVFQDSGMQYRMVARVWRAGEPLLVAFVATDPVGDAFDYVNGSLEGSIVLRTAPDEVFAIDRDEVASPAFVQVGDTWRLYYSARRGARWSIGLLVSRTGEAWRSLGAVLRGDDTGFDALGVRHPAPFRDASEGVGLYYLATDGSNVVLGLAGRPGTLGE